jgi:hypothetical protein
LTTFKKVVKSGQFKNLIFISLKNTIMARPIKNTPVLNGDDAIRFLDKAFVNQTTKPNLTERERIKTNALKFKFV